jgi:hypothetical protein
MASPIRAENSVEKMLAHQMAAAHTEMRKIRREMQELARV